METLETRVARLERSARRWRAAFACLALAAVAGAGVAAARPDDPYELFVGKRIAVKNAAGEIVGGFSTDEAGNGMLAINHANGKTAISLGVNPDTGDADIIVFSRNGKAVWKTPASKNAPAEKPAKPATPARP